MSVQNPNLTDENLDKLIHLIYQTLEDDSAWSEFFKLACDVANAKLIHMLAHDLKTQTVSYSNGINMPAEGELAILHKYQFIDPMIPHLFTTPTLGWIIDHELFSDVFKAEHPFYQEFLLSYDTKYRHVCKLLGNDHALILMAFITSPSQGPLPKETLAFLDKLMPHVSRVCRLGIQNFVYSTQALVGHTLVNKLRQPVILASVTGEVVHVNEAANELLNATSLISVADNQLVLPAKFNTDFFEECAAMEYALKGSEAAPEATQFKLLQIKSLDEQETLYAFYALLLPQRMMGAFGLRPLVMMFFYHPESAPQIDASILNAAFGLTPSECRIAMLVAEGLSQKDIAEKLSLKHDTVRKQLQVIYQKTSTNQQTELVRLMLNVPSNFVQNPLKNRLAE